MHALSAAPRRLATTAGACVAAAMACGAATAQPARPAVDPAKDNPQASNATDQPNISGIWFINEYAFSREPWDRKRMRTVEGDVAPLQHWAQKIYDERGKAADEGRPYANAAARCLPNGMPAMMLGAPYPFQIIQSPSQVTTIHEEPHSFRVIRLNEQHPPDFGPTFMGHSVGHWEGDTLVVDTVGMNPDATIDPTGLPYTDKLHVTERIRRVRPDLLEDVLTFEDPGAFTRPWTIRRTYRLWGPGQQLMEYICLENQRNEATAAGTAGFQEPTRK